VRVSHKNPETGEPQPIGLGWLDDAMTPTGPTESDTNYVNDTGANATEMEAQNAAFGESMRQLGVKVKALGGFWWQLMGDSGAGWPPLAGRDAAGGKQNETQCVATLRKLCVPEPAPWNKVQVRVTTSKALCGHIVLWLDFAWSTTVVIFAGLVLQFYNMGGVGGGSGYVPCGPPFDPIDKIHGFYNGTTPQDLTDYTAEFMLTRGP